MGLEDREWFQEARKGKAGAKESAWRSTPPSPADPPQPERYDKFRLGRIRGLLARERITSRLEGSAFPPPRSAIRLGSGAWVLLVLFGLVVGLGIAAFF